MLLAPASSPSPTPTATLPSIHGAIHLQPRQTYGADFTYGGYAGADCYNLDRAGQCVNILTRCYDKGNAYATDPEAATSCLCTHGISYLDCFFDKVATGTCATYYLGGIDWNEYQMSYYTSICGSVPPSIFAQIKPPSTVYLSLQAVDVVTVEGTLGTPDYNGQPIYDGTGALLNAECTQTDFTLVDAGSTIYYAGFVGCIKDRPECCPWPVATDTAGGIAAAQTEASNGDGDKPKNLGFDYPQPVDPKQIRLAKCAKDYYSISGGCCPVGYWPFTSAVGGQTPCWSSLNRMVDPPTLTVAKLAEAANANRDKSTSAVINIIWSMRYPVQDQGSGGGLSTAAKAGIGAGVGIAVILIAGLGICLCLKRRKNKKTQQQQQQQQQQVPPPVGQEQQQIPYGKEGQGPLGPPPQYALTASPAPAPAPAPTPSQYQTYVQAQAQFPAQSQYPDSQASFPFTQQQSHTPSALVPQHTPSTLVPQETGNTTSGISELVSSQSSYSHNTHNTQSQPISTSGGYSFPSPTPSTIHQLPGHHPAQQQHSMPEMSNESGYGYPAEQAEPLRPPPSTIGSGVLYAAPQPIGQDYYPAQVEEGEHNYGGQGQGQVYTYTTR